MIFFEVLDFPTSAGKAPTSHWQLKLDSSPWYKIAWAFMLPAGRVGKTHMEEKCRLQLFQYPKRRPRQSTETTEVCTHLCDSAFCIGKSRIMVSMQILLNIPKKFRNVYEDISLLNFHVHAGHIHLYVLAMLTFSV